MGIQDPEVRAIGEDCWARWAEHPAAKASVEQAKEWQRIFATKGHVLESTQLFGDWASLHCKHCSTQWSAFVHKIELGFFVGLEERCKGGG